MIPVLLELDFDGAREAIVDVWRDLYAPPMGPALDAAAGILVASAEMRISNTKTDPSGNAWAPWSPAYASVTRSESLLLGTGRMRGSIDAEVSGPDEVTVFADTPYAARQQWGGGGIPSREYLGMSDDDGDLIAQAFAEHLADVLMGAVP